jgi:HAE1 family hydrophobic/amphiphilic exporter-1
VKVVSLDKRKRTTNEIQNQIVEIAESIPGVKSMQFQEGGANAMGGGGRPIQIEIYGDDFDLIDPVAAEIKDKIEHVPGVVEPGISREKSNPEYQLEIDREKAADLGLTMADIGMAARNYLYGSIATKYRETGDEYDMFVRLRQEDRKSLDDIKNVFVTTRTGANVALSNIATIKLASSPQVISRKNQQRYVVVDSDYYGRALGDVVKDVRKVIDKINIPDSLAVKIAGNTEQMEDSFKSLLGALLLGLALIYLVMVAQFESFLEPFIIMFAIPFALAGVIWSLFLTGSAFGVMSFIGLILVAGIAVKNSIVLVDYTNILRARKIELKEAIIEAGKTRLRPILMTSTCTILGLMPILLGKGEGTSFWKNMSLSVMGGLLVSMTISLVFVPAIYYIIEKRERIEDIMGED